MADWRALLGDSSDDDGLAGVAALVGAGISVDAGLPVAYGLFDEIVGDLVRSRWASEELVRLARSPRTDMRDEHDFIRFETLLLWVGRIFDPRLALFSFLDSFDVPGDLHRRLAHAGCRGMDLVTVNFDDLIERALIEQGMEPVTVADAQPPSPDDERVPVYKLHGTRVRHLAGGVLPERGELLATTQIIAATHPGTLLNDDSRRLLASLLDGRTLLVAGYSASDDLDVVPTLAASTPRRVVWIDHSDTHPRRVQLPMERPRLSWQRLLARLARSGSEVIVIRGRTSEAFESLGLVSPAGSYRALAKVAWRPQLRSWAQSVRAHDPTGLGLAALLFGELGRYQQTERALAQSRPSKLPDGRWTAARRTYELGQSELLREGGDRPRAYALARQAKERASLPVDERTVVLSELLMGRAAFLEQRYSLAASHFRAAQDMTRPSSTEHAHARAWHGRSHVWAGRPARGLRYLERAAEAFRRRGELDALLDATEAIGVAYSTLMRLTDAERALKEASGLAETLGYFDRRFTTATSLAETRLLAGDFDEAERRVRSALRTLGSAGHDEIADAHAVHADCALACGQLRAASDAARRALKATNAINRRRTLELLCSLAEAQSLSCFHRAENETLLRARDCEADEVTALGRARLRALATVAEEDGRFRAATRQLSPAATVRLADTLGRLGLSGPAVDRVGERARGLRQSPGAKLR